MVRRMEKEVEELIHNYEEAVILKAAATINSRRYHRKASKEELSANGKKGAMKRWGYPQED